MALSRLILLAAFFSTFSTFSIHAQSHGEVEGTPKFRAALLLGHTLITPEHSDDHLFIPSWGFDLEYWPVEDFGVGFHSDIELESFIIIAENNEEVERINPLVITLDALYRPWKDLVLVVGPGLEIEQNNTYELFRIGVEYEVEFGHHFDLCHLYFTISDLMDTVLFRLR